METVEPQSLVEPQSQTEDPQSQTQVHSPPGRSFSLDVETKQRIARIFTPTTTKKVVVAWNFVRKDGKILESEIKDAWSRYLSDLPLAPITKEITAAIEAARTVSDLFLNEMIANF